MAACDSFSDGDSDSCCDRLSSLPISLLHHILSFLPTRNVVQLSLLSTKWRCMWNSMPSLVIDEISFHPANQKRRRALNFMNFVDRVLMFRDTSDLQQFRLSFGHCCDFSRAEKWMYYAKMRCVQELDLSINVGRFPGLLDPLFACTSLKEMMLDLHGGTLRLPPRMNLPNLSALHLHSLSMCGSGSSVRLLLACCPRLELFTMEKCSFRGVAVVEFSECSSLEVLTLMDCELIGIGKLSISAQKLTTLIIDSCRGRNCKIEICTPGIQSFIYRSNMARVFSVVKLSSQLDAIVDFLYSGCISDNHHSGDEDRATAGIQLLKVIEKAKSLSLSSSSVALLLGDSFLPKLLPISFTNLKYLKLGTKELNSDHVQVITCFVKCSPNLETLIIDNLPKQCGEEGCQKAAEFPTDCMPCHLKEVEIRQFNGNENELNLVKFLLKNAIMLERVVIIPSKLRFAGRMRRQREISQELLTFPRASSRIALLFFPHAH